MNNPVLQTVQSRILYLSIWVIVMIIQVFLINYSFSLSPPSLYYCCYDSLIGNALQAGCILALWHPVRYYRNITNTPLLLFFHVLLIGISFVLWMGLGYLITSSVLDFNPNYTLFFIQILPFRICFGLLIYVISVLIYYLLLNISEKKVQKALLENVKTDSAMAPDEKLTRISIKKRQEIHLIPVSQIHYIEANGDYVLIHTADNKYLKDRTMKYWETHLPEDSFIRIHRSYIINTEHIVKIELYEKEIYKVQLKNGNNLKVSNTGYKLLKQKMKL